MSARFHREALIPRLRAAAPAVLPSMLLCDFGHLQQEIERVEAAGVAALHLDVMDGHFVPNLTYGMTIVRAARESSRLPLDVHLMIEQPERYLEAFYEAGADVMTIHAEAVDDPRPVLEQIRSLGAMSGLAINPATPLAAVERALPVCDLLLVMSVVPGFGGQSFDESVLDKLRELAARDDVEPLLEIDGGVNADTVAACAAAGAELMVVGSAIFRSDDYQSVVSGLTESARAAATV